jgi:protocatechuate 3,4-dioxygenase beta subunit
MPPVTRRRALSQAFAWAGAFGVVRTLTAGGPQGLDQFVNSPPCKDDKLTPAVAPQPAFALGAPARTSLIEQGATGPRVVLTGHVIGLKCGRIKGARVDFWQADAAGAYPASGSRLRGHQLTDNDGKYRLETIRPGAPAGRARHLSARVEPPGKPALTTVLFFPADPANAKDKSFQPQLVMSELGGAPAGTYAFDFILDL